jgi:hypothetical protein
MSFCELAKITFWVSGAMTFCVLVAAVYVVLT